MKKISLNGWQRLWVLLAVICVMPAGAFVAYNWPTVEIAKDYDKYYDKLTLEARGILIRPGTVEDRPEFIEFVLTITTVPTF